MSEDFDPEFFEQSFWANVRSLHSRRFGSRYSETTTKVGPFWFGFYGGKELFFVDETVPLLQSDKYEPRDPKKYPTRGRAVDHSSLWQKAQAQVEDWKDLEFYEVPRGRIVFKGYGEYTVFLYRGWLENEELKRAILEKFNLPESATKFMASPEVQGMSINPVFLRRLWDSLPPPRFGVAKAARELIEFQKKVWEERRQYIQDVMQVFKDKGERIWR